LIAVHSPGKEINKITKQKALPFPAGLFCVINFYALHTQRSDNETGKISALRLCGILSTLATRALQSMEYAQREIEAMRDQIVWEAAHEARRWNQKP